MQACVFYPIKYVHKECILYHVAASKAEAKELKKKKHVCNGHMKGVTFVIVSVTSWITNFASGLHSSEERSPKSTFPQKLFQESEDGPTEIVLELRCRHGSAFICFRLRGFDYSPKSSCQRPQVCSSYTLNSMKCCVVLRCVVLFTVCLLVRPIQTICLF